jgi:hypothetical protein
VQGGIVQQRREFGGVGHGKWLKVQVAQLTSPGQGRSPIDHSRRLTVRLETRLAADEDAARMGWTRMGDGSVSLPVKPPGPAFLRSR